MSGMLFLRHAETDLAGTFCGHSDPEVNDAGMAQIEGLIRRLAREAPLDVVYTSDLKRARTTAEAVAQVFGVKCVVRPALRELHFGAWEGMRWEEVSAADRPFAERWAAEFPMVPAPGGESYPCFGARVLQEVEALQRLGVGRRLAVVTHAGVLGVILTDLLGLTAAAAWKRTREYCCVVAYGGERDSKGDGR
jgi:broad specificity phosphatase PhoE